MPRRKPAAAPQSESAAALRLSRDDLDELLAQAKVPKAKRAACTCDINELFDQYNDWVARKNAPTEASQAESFRLVTDAARKLWKALASLPAGLRLAIEPDYRAFAARHAAKATAYALAARELAKADPEAQGLADQTTLLPEAARWRASRGLSARAAAPLPLELTLALLIETAETRRAEIEKQVSRGRSKRRATFWRNQLAVNLKAIGMAYSPTLAKDEKAAENWTAVALETARIAFPDPETNPGSFRAMFAR